MKKTGNKRICSHILSLDPSGNFHEGKGTTGWNLIDVFTKRVTQFGEIDAALSGSIEEHWQKHIDLINKYNNSCRDLDVVIEDYLLYSAQAASQTNSRMETPKLIGCIQLHCALQKVPLEFQTAASVKKRWSDTILVKKGYLVEKPHGQYTRYYLPLTNGDEIMTTNHLRDSIRHGVHYLSFRVNK